MENQNTIYLYDDEIDLKAYIKTILSCWIWIVLACVAVGLITFVFLSFKPARYSSTALVSVSAPILEVEFGTDITTTDGAAANIQNNDLPTLALSDEVMFNLFQQVQQDLPDGFSNHIDLKKSLSATTEARSGIIALTGLFSDPALSAQVVDEWSKLFVQSANLFFEGSQDTSQKFLQEKLTIAEAERDAIDAKLVEFQAQDQTSFVQTQLEANRGLQQTYIGKRNAFELILYDIDGLKNQIDQNPNDPNVLTDLTLFALQDRTFGTAGNIQIDVTSFDNLSASTLESRIALLNGLETVVKAQHAKVEGLIAGLEPLILFQQQQIQELSLEFDILSSEDELVKNTYLSLSKKVAESEIEQGNTQGRAQIASRAIVPIEPESRGRLTTTALAMIVAGMLSVGIVLVRAWWMDEGDNATMNQSNPDFSNGIG